MSSTLKDFENGKKVYITSHFIGLKSGFGLKLGEFSAITKRCFCAWWDWTEHIGKLGNTGILKCYEFFKFSDVLFNFTKQWQHFVKRRLIIWRDISFALATINFKDFKFDSNIPITLPFKMYQSHLFTRMTYGIHELILVLACNSLVMMKLYWFSLQVT